ncbi:MAG: FAD-binding oxidoreductase [Pseudomonadota bacterium]
MSQPDFAKLQSDIEGVVLLPGSSAYEVARSLWNALIDRRPAAILQAVTKADVVAGVRFARVSGMKISVRGGGHNIAGTASGAGMLMIDLSRMNAVSTDTAARTATVEGGATLHDLDVATIRHGLATPGGVVSSTGVAGLTLGGGFGWLSRLHGLAADNVLSVELVTAKGDLIVVDPVQKAELFWGLRGGSGNFGIATAITFRLHDMPREVLFGPMFFALEDASEVLRKYREFAAQVPRHCCVWADLMTAPPAPFLPESHHGQKVLGLMQCFVGEAEEGRVVLAPLREFARPLGDAVDPRPFIEAQQFLDETYAKGMRNYWKSGNFTILSDGVIDELVELARSMPTPQCDIQFSQLGGQIADVASDATAFPHRDVGFVVTPGARWESADGDDMCMRWIEEAGAVLRRHEDGGQYVNFVAEREGSEDRAYGSNIERLRRLKALYDPDNLFASNQNIRPAA